MRLPLPQFSSQSRHPGYFAEVIETATTEFLAQCLEPEDLSFAVMPPFGSWVKARDEESGNVVYAVVYHATTSPIDSVHRARALGLSLEDLREQQPQIFAMLKTEFRAAIVGFESGRSAESTRNGSGTKNGNGRKNGSSHAHTSGIIYQHLPPRPPQIHQAVYYCEPEEVLHFSEQLDFLRTLLQVNGAPVDGLAAAAIREIYRLRQADRQWLVQAGRTLSILLKDDYDRLRIILSQIYI
ncbi:HAS-barrel domain-containing protein [Leptolyngbya ohadii]|uniref:HAS-barrel domain-containing protein n=1 Tax=Leptolyngbya ohadii TaxID=1962290 RepID=UPI000B5A0DB2|nr:HAS-barrel domain-containing protein [Leptolyngbya ohadii]